MPTAYGSIYQMFRLFRNFEIKPELYHYEQLMCRNEQAMIILNYSYLAFKTQTIMKKLLFSIFILTSIVISAQETENTEVNTFIDRWHQDAADVNREAYFDKIDEDGIFIGTDATEIWTKPEFYDWAEPQFTNGGRAWDFKAIDRNLYWGKKSNYVWFDELLTFSGGTLRGSGVLLKRKGGWKIMHYVLSLPVPNEKFGAVLKAMDE